MTNQEILDYLKSTGLYDSRIDLLHIKDMLNDNLQSWSKEQLRLIKNSMEGLGTSYKFLRI